MIVTLGKLKKITYAANEFICLYTKMMYAHNLHEFLQYNLK